MTDRRPLRTGTMIRITGAGGPVEAEVVSYTLNGDIQLITAKDATGHLHRVAMDLSDPAPAEGAAIIDIDYARALAVQVLAGHRHRLPVTVEANILAEAVLALTGGPAPAHQQTVCEAGDRRCA